MRESTNSAMKKILQQHPSWIQNQRPTSKKLTLDFAKSFWPFLIMALIFLVWLETR